MDTLRTMVMPQTSPASVPDKGHREFQMVMTVMPRTSSSSHKRRLEPWWPIGRAAKESPRRKKLNRRQPVTS